MAAGLLVVNPQEVVDAKCLRDDELVDHLAFGIDGLVIEGAMLSVDEIVVCYGGEVVLLLGAEVGLAVLFGGSLKPTDERLQLQAGALEGSD